MLSLTTKKQGEDVLFFFFFSCFYFFSALRKLSKPQLKDKDFSAVVLGSAGD